MCRSAARGLQLAALLAGMIGGGLLLGQEAPPRTTFPPGRPPASPPPGAPKSSPAAPIPAARPAQPGKPLAAPRSTPTKEQIATWIRELDADEFFTRETASLQLLEAGPSVLPALKPVLTGGSLEATSRALVIVRQIGLAADFDTQDQAGDLLAELAARNEAPALARRAAAALEELTQQRSVQALAELEELGAKIIRSQVLGGIALDEPVLSIEVGDAFRGDEHALRRLKWITGAPLLIFQGKQVQDGWIKQAAGMPGLQELHLYQTSISDAALAPLSDAGTLKQVGLYYTPVSEAALAPLARLPLLAFVKLYGTKATALGVKEFQKTAGIAIDFRRGAFLGVSGRDIDPRTCKISGIHEGSPAAKAGLAPEDTVIGFGGEVVGDFGSLTTLISQYDAGDEVEIIVTRQVIDDQGGLKMREISTKVTLAPWDVEPAVRNSRR